MTKARFFHEPFDTRIHNIMKVDLVACIHIVNRDLPPSSGQLSN